MTPTRHLTRNRSIHVPRGLCPTSVASSRLCKNMAFEPLNPRKSQRPSSSGSLPKARRMESAQAKPPFSPSTNSTLPRILAPPTSPATLLSRRVQPHELHQSSFLSPASTLQTRPPIHPSKLVYPCEFHEPPPLGLQGPHQPGANNKKKLRRSRGHCPGVNIQYKKSSGNSYEKLTEFPITTKTT